VIAASPTALQLRYLQTLSIIAAERGSSIFFPIPIDILSGMVRDKQVYDICIHVFYRVDWVEWAKRLKLCNNCMKHYVACTFYNIEVVLCLLTCLLMPPSYLLIPLSYLYAFTLFITF